MTVTRQTCKLITLVPGLRINPDDISSITEASIFHMSDPQLASWQVHMCSGQSYLVHQAQICDLTSWAALCGELD